MTSKVEPGPERTLMPAKANTVGGKPQGTAVGTNPPFGVGAIITGVLVEGITVAEGMGVNVPVGEGHGVFVGAGVLLGWFGAFVEVGGGTLVDVGTGGDVGLGGGEVGLGALVGSGTGVGVRVGIVNALVACTIPLLNTKSPVPKKKRMATEVNSFDMFDMVRP
jgi:hypothetical protein